MESFGSYGSSREGVGVGVGSTVLVGLGRASVGVAADARVGPLSPQAVHSGTMARMTSEKIAARTKLSRPQSCTLRRGSLLRLIPPRSDLRRGGVTLLVPSLPILTPLRPGLHRG